MDFEILIREKGGEPKWVSASKVFRVSGTRKPYSPSSPYLKKEFEEWYNLYNKKTTKKQAINYWYKNIKKDMIPKIMEHTKLYIEGREKIYRKDPIRYLRDKVWEDEIIKKDERIDIKDYKHDTTGMPMGKCETCGKRDTYRNQWELYQGSRCCGAKVLPFN